MKDEDIVMITAGMNYEHEIYIQGYGYAKEATEMMDELIDFWSAKYPLGQYNYKDQEQQDIVREFFNQIENDLEKAYLGFEQFDSLFKIRLITG